MFFFVGKLHCQDIFLGGQIYKYGVKNINIIFHLTNQLCKGLLFSKCRNPVLDRRLLLFSELSLILTTITQSVFFLLEITNSKVPIIIVRRSNCHGQLYLDCNYRKVIKC